MALEIKTPSEIRDDYLTHLESLKPGEVNVDQQDSDWYVRGSVVGGVVAGARADIRQVGKDIFPQSARRDALEQHSITWFGTGLKGETQSQGLVTVTGSIASVVPLGTVFTHEPTGNTYTATEATVLSATAQDIPVISVATGQEQNLLDGAPLVISSPPAGIDADAVVSGDLADGRNEETDQQAVDRILTRIRQRLDGGREIDYKQFALDADPAVVNANVLVHSFGLGTLSIVITAGTTDIDEAIDNGDPIVISPSPALIDTVQEYVNGEKVVTDCVLVVGPAEVPIDVSVTACFVDGDLTTIREVDGQSLTQEDLVKREVRRALYKTPPGGRAKGNQGYVFKSDIEETIDFNLSADPVTLGQKIEMLTDRIVGNLSASGANRALLSNEAAVPGTITVVEG